MSLTRRLSCCAAGEGPGAAAGAAAPPLGPAAAVPLAPELAGCATPPAIGMADRKRCSAADGWWAQGDRIHERRLDFSTLKQEEGHIPP